MYLHGDTDGYTEEEDEIIIDPKLLATQALPMHGSQSHAPLTPTRNLPPAHACA